MSDFTEMEKAALGSIFSETPEFCAELEVQLGQAVVTKRENTGGGFFTDITVSDDAPRLRCANVLGHETHARIPGLEHGLGFVLFMENGALHLLEGFAYGPESTASLDLINVPFEIFRQPISRGDSQL